MPQMNIFSKRGNHKRSCKSFRKRRQCNYISVSKHWLYIKTVFLFGSWKLHSPLLSSKAFHARESEIMTGWGLVVRWSWRSFMCLVTLLHLPHFTHHAQLSFQRPIQQLADTRMLWNPQMPLSYLFIFFLIVWLNISLGSLKQIQLIDSESSAFKHVWLILVLFCQKGSYF